MFTQIKPPYPPTSTNNNIPPINMEKQCTKCNQVKSFDLFSKDKYRSDGLSCACKECRKKEGLKYIANKNLSIEKAKVDDILGLLVP